MWDNITIIINYTTSIIISIFSGIKNFIINDNGKLNLIGLMLILILSIGLIELVFNAFISLIKRGEENESN